MKGGATGQKEPSKLTERVYVAEEYPAISNKNTTSSEPQHFVTRSFAAKHNSGMVSINESRLHQDSFYCTEVVRACKNASDTLSESIKTSLVDKSKTAPSEVENSNNTSNAAASDIFSNAPIMPIEVGQSEGMFNPVGFTTYREELSSNDPVKAVAFKENAVLVTSPVSNQGSLQSVYAEAERAKDEIEVHVSEVTEEKKLTLEIPELSKFEGFGSAETMENSYSRNVLSHSNLEQKPGNIVKNQDIVSDESLPHVTGRLHEKNPAGSPNIIDESPNLVQKTSPESNLSWAAEEVLTSPTKFRHGLRRSSLQFGDSPTEEGHVKHLKLLRIRRRSNSVLDESVRNLQFGDMPVDGGPVDKPVGHPAQGCGSSQHVESDVPSTGRTLDSYGEEFGGSTSQNVTFNPLSGENPYYSNHQYPAAPMDSPMYHQSGSGSLYGTPPPPGYTKAPFGHSTVQSLPPGGASKTPHYHGQSPTPGYAIHPQFNSPSIHHAHPPASRSHSDARKEYQAEWHEQQAWSGPGSHSPGIANSYQQSVAENQDQIPADFYCTFCSGRSYPTPQNRLIFCFGCGPQSNIRYCSIACCLAHSYDHARFAQCLNYPQSQRLSEFNLPPVYIFEQFPIKSLFGVDSPEKFRQKVFSMYCHSGPFPEVMRAWAKQYPFHGQDLNETRWKKTGTRITTVLYVDLLIKRR
jgi:hypothetical protein